MPISTANTKPTIIVASVLLLATIIATTEQVPQGASAAAPATATDLCPHCPICDIGWKGIWPPLSQCLYSKGDLSDEPTMLRCLRTMLRAYIKGQDKALREVLNFMAKRITQPLSSKNVLHIAGDNGVGKSYTAKLISMATSLSMHPDCGTEKSHSCIKGGSNLLVISCASFGDEEENSGNKVASKISSRIASHLRKHPRGIILIDDVNELEPEQGRRVTNMLCKSEQLADDPDINMLAATIIITSDLGKEGRTRSLSDEQVRTLIANEVVRSFDSNALNRVTTVTYSPLDTDGVEKMIESVIRMLPCRDPLVVAASFDAEVLSHFTASLVEGTVGEYLKLRNGRVVEERVQVVLDSAVAERIREQGKDTKYRVHLRLSVESKNADGVDIIVSPVNAGGFLDGKGGGGVGTGRTDEL